MSAPAVEPRKRVRLEHDERRELMLGCARQLFSERPYPEVAMGEIAAAAGVARGLLNHYFGSKRDLYLEVIRDVVKVPTMPLPRQAASLPAEAVWEASVDGWLSLIDANRDLWLMAIDAGGTGRDPEIEAILGDARELLAYRALQALGFVDPAITDEVMAVVRGYGGLAEELTREWLERRRLTRAQVRVLLLGSLPLLLDELLPGVRAAGGSPV